MSTSTHAHSNTQAPSENVEREQKISVAGITGEGEKAKVSVLDEETAIRQAGEDIPDAERFAPAIQQAFIVPQVKNLAGLQEIFKGNDDNMIGFINRKIAAHCQVRITNLLKQTEKAADGSLKFTYKTDKDPVDLTGYVAEPLREQLTQKVRLERLLKQHFGGDADLLKKALAEIGD